MFVRDQTWAREMAAKRAASEALGACVVGARTIAHAPAAPQTSTRMSRDRERAIWICIAVVTVSISVILINGRNRDGSCRNQLHFGGTSAMI
jgi:hypothetical protein